MGGIKASYTNVTDFAITWESDLQTRKGLLLIDGTLEAQAVALHGLVLSKDCLHSCPQCLSWGGEFQKAENMITKEFRKKRIAYCAAKHVLQELFCFS